MATKTRVSLDEFLAKEQPEAPYLELIEGEAREKPMPNPIHAALVAELLAELVVYLRRTMEGRAFTELRHLHREQEWVFLPDISVTLRERLAGVALDENRPVEVMPDFAIEVLSPDDRPGRLAQKIAHYMRAGVRLLWVVDPETEQVTVWEAGASPSTATGEGALDAAPVLPGFAVDLEALFARIREA